MPKKNQLGGVFTTDTDGNIKSKAASFTENIGGLIFDTKVVSGLDKALTTEEAKKAFAGGAVVELNTYKDIAALGLDDTVMYGLPKHHLQNFFKYAGDGQRLFVSFMDSSTDSAFDAVEKLQLAASGLIDHIGVWTSEPFAKAGTDGSAYTVATDGIINKLQLQAEKIGGKIGVTNYEGNAPAVILLNAPVISGLTVDYKLLPDVSVLDAPKVAVLLGQPATDDVHAIQAQLGGVPVGNIGAALAVLSLAPADMALHYVAQFNLSSIMTTAELGFGKVTVGTDKKSLAADSALTNINTVSYADRQKYLHKNGYIFLRDHEGIENGVFFSSDSTCTMGDYRTIIRCRVMHKARRAVRAALLPYVGKSWEVDAATGELGASDVSLVKSAITTALDTQMKWPGGSTPQISGRKVVFDGTDDFLNNDEFHVGFSIVPKGVSDAIYCEEGYASTISTK